MDVTAEIPVIMLTDLSFMQENGASLLPSDLMTQYPAFLGLYFLPFSSSLCTSATLASSVAPEHGQANLHPMPCICSPLHGSALRRRLHVGLPLTSSGASYVTCREGPLNTMCAVCA